MAAANTHSLLSSAPTQLVNSEAIVGYRCSAFLYHVDIMWWAFQKDLPSYIPAEQ